MPSVRLTIASALPSSSGPLAITRSTTDDSTTSGISLVISP